MIVVTGANGQLGRAIVECLIKRLPANQVGVSVRDPAKCANLVASGVRVRHGDYGDAASLRHAFEGATQVLLVSSNAASTGGDPLDQHRTAITAAIEAGVDRIVYTSQMAASATSKFPPARDHAATEAILAESGLAWTALRHGFYASSGLMMTADGRAKGAIEAPQDGRVAWTAHADLAEAAAAILLEGGFDGPTPPLTGSQTLDYAGLARVASEATGRPFQRVVLTDDEFRVRVASRGASPQVAAIALGFFVAARDGEFDHVDPALERLIGRAPLTIQDLMTAQAGG